MGRRTAALSANDVRTQAPPREAFGAGIEREVEAAKHAWQFAVLIEIANFTVLRRFVGPWRADVVTAEIARAVQSLLPKATVRVAGRTLMEVTLCGTARRRLDTTVHAIEAMFDDPMDVDGEQFKIDAWIGSAAMPAIDFDEIKLIEGAEEALAEARMERNNVARDVLTSASGIDRISLARDLRHAIAADEFFLQYQPKIHVRRQEVAGVEALIRWRHPDRGLVMPGDFIPIAEESNDIVGLTLWTLRRVIADQRTLAERGHDLPIFINIAGVLLANARFVREACALVQESQAKIGFEITETSVIRDPSSAISNLKTFSDIGITVAIDDYGAGLSSLAYLKQLPARELKIDKLFVTQLTSSNRDPLIVRSTIDLAHALEMEVVAEGVETQAALALLAVMGCDMAQGFLISRPVGLDALLKFLDEGRAEVMAVLPALNGRFTPTWQQ